jgi:hypothetical protein
MATRDELIKRLEWNDGGYGFGACAVGNAMMWGDDKPTETKPDLVSTVCVSGPQSKYTDEELTALCVFADLVDPDYDSRWRWRRGCNMVVFDKLEHCWIRKRLSWVYGPMTSDTLAEAIKVMSRDYTKIEVKA